MTIWREVHGTKRRNRETGGGGESEKKKIKKSCSLEGLNEVEMCPPQGFPGNYICSANRGEVGGGFEQQGGEYVQGAKGVVSQNAIRESAK